MRLLYNTLWIEDDREWLEATKELFEVELEQLGFRLNPTIIRNGDTIDELILQNGFADFDLILVDFNLEHAHKGNTIIEKIRQHEIYTEVLFYSKDPDLVRKSLHDQGLEGVYTADRATIEDKFLKVMNTTIKKTQEVNTMRGLIVAETSILDDRALTIIEDFIDQGTEASKLLAEYIFECVEKTHRAKSVDFNRYKDASDIHSLLQDPLLFGAYMRAKAVQRLGKLKGIGELAGFTEEYTKEVIKVRNVFAHAKEIREEGVSILKGSNEEFNHDRCVEIRQKLITYANIFDEVDHALSIEG